VTEFTVRLPSLMCGIGVVLITSSVAFRLAVLNRALECSYNPQRVALIAAASLTLTYGFHTMAGQAMVDMCFTLLVWCAVWAALSTEPHQWRDERSVSAGARALFWIACAGAVLARGPIGVVLPVLLVVAPAAVVFGARVVLREVFRPSLGWLAFGVPAAWYYVAYSDAGTAFVERQLLFENLRRFLGGEHVNAQPWWFYAPSLLRSTAPWGVLTLLCWLTEMRRPQSGHLFAIQCVRLRFSVPMVALAAAVLFFSFSAGKRHSYMLPLYPLLAIQLGLLGATWLERGGARVRYRLRALSRRLEATVATLLFLVLLGTGLFLSATWSSHPLYREVQLALAQVTPRLGCIVLVTLLLLVVRGGRSLKGSLFSVWAGLMVLMVSVLTEGASVKAYLRNFEGMSLAWLAQASEGDQLTIIKAPFDEYFDPILWYVHRSVDVVRSDRGEPPCAARRLYLAHRSWVTQHAGSLQGEIALVGTLQELGNVAKNGRGHELVMFRCTPRSTDHPRSEQPSTMLEASATDRLGIAAPAPGDSV
jgi:4-amino-4-deoxy-L-arabinose transferase-like glycosyltransferase